MGYKPAQIDDMMKTYSKFGLSDAQLAQLRQKLATMRPDPAVTNALITSDARNDIWLGHTYVPEGTIDNATRQPVKNQPSILQSRNNLLKFIEGSPQSGSAPRPGITADQFFEGKKTAVQGAMQGPKAPPVQGPDPMQGPKPAPPVQTNPVKPSLPSGGPARPASYPQIPVTSTPTSRGPHNVRVKGVQLDQPQPMQGPREGKPLGPQRAPVQGPRMSTPTSGASVKPPAPGPAPAQGFLRTALGKLGRLVGPVARITGIPALVHPDSTLRQRAEGALTVTAPLLSSAYAALKGAAESGDYGGMSAIAGQDLTKPLPENYAFDGSAATNPENPNIRQEDGTIAPQSVAPPTETPTAPPTTEDLEKIYHHPDLKGPKGNEVGSDSDPAEPGRQGPGDPPGPPGAVRTNENNVVQVGRSLSGANAALEGLGLAPLQDAARFFEGYKPTARTGGFSADDAQVMGMSKKDAETIGAGGSVETLITPTSAGATGQDASNPQAGISGAADVGDAKRTIADATSGIGPDPRFSKGAIRRASVRAFLDAPAGSGYNAIRARDAAAGISRIPGQEGVLINGEFRQFADGVDQKQMRQAAYAATGDGFATKEAQDKWSGLFLKRAEEAKADTPTAEKPAAPAEPAQEVKPGTPIKPVVIPQAVIDRAKGMTYDPSNPTKQDPEYARLRDASDAQWLATRTHKDVFDDATQSWKKVPINR